MNRSKNPFKVYYPLEIQTWKAKLGYWYHWQFYLLELGRGHIIGKFTQLLPELGVFILILDKVGIVNLDLWQMAIIIISAMLGLWFMGWMYQYIGMDQIYNIMSINRNPMMKDIYDKNKGDVRK